MNFLKCYSKKCVEKQELTDGKEKRFICFEVIDVLKFNLVLFFFNSHNKSHKKENIQTGKAFPF